MCQTYQQTLDTYNSIWPQSTDNILESSPFATNISYPFHNSNHHSQLNSHPTFYLVCSISLSTFQMCFNVTPFDLFCLSCHI